MPLYEYYCEHCNGIFEALRPMREASKPCPCPLCERDSQRIMPTSFAPSPSATATLDVFLTRGPTGIWARK